jgi:hypothetical protein
LINRETKNQADFLARKFAENNDSTIVSTRANMATQGDLQALIAAMTAASNAQAQAVTDAIAAAAAATAAATAAAAAAGAAPAAIPIAPAPPVPAFALLPGSTTVNPLDFSKTQDMKVYIAATTGLDKKFDLKEDSLHLFLTEVKERVRTYGWTGILQVPDNHVPPIQRNVLTNFGQVTLDDCHRHALTYHGTQTRDAQNSMFLYQFLHDSLSEDAKAIMVSNVTMYSIEGVPVGLLFLKLLIGKASIDTNAKVLLLREQVSSLHIKMRELKGDVRAFNTYVDQLRTALEGRGQHVDELISHLFKAYEAVPDPNFVRYISNKRDQYDEGIHVPTDDELMLLACNKYDLLGHRSTLPDSNDDLVVALEVKNQTQARTGKGKRKNHPEWKLVKPAPGEPQTKKVGEKTFNWCPYHQLWSIHTAAECKKGGNSTGGSATTTKHQDPPKEKEREETGKLKSDQKYSAFIRAAKAVFDSQQDSDDEST